ncbi:hypothetical protein [Streptomyces sp. NPDC002133]|uniref:tetratricopeptide repeat protein n=1 Tax=Streptomyces sp. NPDC002133 TaxID=3154409 RepID=UPI003323F73A
MAAATRDTSEAGSAGRSVAAPDPSTPTSSGAPARGELLARLGRPDEARAEFERAAELTRNAAERGLFRERVNGPSEPSA